MLNRDEPQVTVTAGDVRDLAATGRAVQGADAVVSAIGGTCPGNPAVLQQGTAAILTAMSRHGVRRLIVIQGFHLAFPGDPRNLGRPVMTAMLRLWNRHLIADSHRMAEVLRESELDWTLIRMPLRTAGPTAGGYGVGHLALGPWSRVTTGQVADFTLACLATGGFARESPMIADARRWSRKPSAAATDGQLAAGGEPSSPASEPADHAGGANTLQAAAAGVHVVAVDRGASPMSSQTLRTDAGRPEPGTQRTAVPPTACSAGEPDCGGDSAEAAARQRIAQARAWQWRAGLRGDLCEHRSATAALQRACDELTQGSTIAPATRPASPSAPPSSPSGPALPSSRARPCGPPDKNNGG